MITKINSEDMDALVRAAELISECHKNGGVIYTAGNGGSAADAQHFASELRENSIRAECLNINSSYTLAIANDYGFNTIFARQIEHLGRPNDVLCVYSISGTSQNIVAAAEVAKKNNMKLVVFTSERPTADKLSAVADVAIRSRSTDMQRCQEYHGLAFHTIWLLVMKNFDIKYHQ